MRSSGGTYCALARSVVVFTKSRIARFAGPSFQVASGSVCAFAVVAPSNAGIAVRTPSTKRRLATTDSEADMIGPYHVRKCQEIARRALLANRPDKLNRVQFGTVGFPSWPRIPLFPYGDLRQNKAFSDQCYELTISAGARRLRICAIWP